MPEMMSVLQKAYTPMPDMKILTEIPDFKEFLSTPRQPSVSRKLNEHSFQHQFKIEQEERETAPQVAADGTSLPQQTEMVTIMRGKQYSTHEYWEPREGVHLLQNLHLPETNMNREIKAAKLLALCMRTKNRQGLEAGTTTATAMATATAMEGLDAYKAALHESRQHMTAEQLAWWDMFWEE